MKSSSEILILPASDSSLLLKLGHDISLETHKKVAALTKALLSQRFAGIRNIHPGYNSILIFFDATATTHSKVEKFLRALLEQEITSRGAKRAVRIPTCYGGKFGPDLDEVANQCHLSPSEVIQLHSSANYTVYFLGFSPGFPYLGGLPAQLRTPRLAVPRMKVPAGSVAIGGDQTGIYPLDSPGGWQIIGRTPLKLFDAARSEPTLLQIGDSINFVSIPESDFDQDYAG